MEGSFLESSNKIVEKEILEEEAEISPEFIQMQEYFLAQIVEGP